MKRLHLIGKSDDNKRLVFARTKGAKSGTFDVPVNPRLVQLAQEIAAGAGKKAERGRSAPGDDAGALQKAAAPASGGAEPDRPRERMESPTSKLSPAEIQVLLRGGRSARSVANEADAPLWWVQRLGEPIEQERGGVINLMFQSRLVRARRGASAEPIGLAILSNLRTRGVGFPERVLERGFNARRTDGVWQIRLGYDYRGRRVTARWSFDPETRRVEPRNTLAAQLSWVAPSADTESLAAAPSGSEGEAEAAPAPAKRAVRRKPARKRSAKRPTARRPRKTLTRKKGTGRKPARKGSRKKVGRKKAASARKRVTRRRKR
jgi:hypothetical protein